MITDPDSDQYKHLPFRSPAALEVFEYGRELARQRKGGDGTDLISILVNRTPEDGEPLSATDFDNYFLLLRDRAATRPPGTQSASRCWR